MVGREAAVGRIAYSVNVVKYRPLRRIPPADRPPGNEPFCGAFSSVMAPQSMRSVLFRLLLMGSQALRVYPSAGVPPMHLASDYIHPYKDAGGRPARCRIRIYL